MTTFVVLNSLPVSAIITFPALALFLGWFLALAFVGSAVSLVPMIIANRGAGRAKRSRTPRLNISESGLAHHKV